MSSLSQFIQLFILALSATTLAGPLNQTTTTGMPLDCPTICLTARVDWVQECIAELLSRGDELVTVSGPDYSNDVNVCFRGDTSGVHSSTGISVGHMRTGTHSATRSAIACGAQAILDQCRYHGERYELTCGGNAVCGSDEMYVDVTGMHNGALLPVTKSLNM